MNQLSGYVEIEMGGESLPFKFGTNCWALFCERRKIDFYQIESTGVFGEVKDGVIVKMPDFFALRDLYYSAHVSASRSKGVQPKAIEVFSDLLDETEGAIVKLQEAMLTAKVMGFSITSLAREGKDANF